MDVEDADPRLSGDEESPDRADAAAPWAQRRWVLAGAGLLALGVALIVAGRMRSAAAGAVCGNRVVETGEECDDGNGNGEDGCIACKLATCGDGVRRAFVEECDDGNRIEGDGCSSGCVVCNNTPTSFSAPGSGHCYWRESTPLPFPAAAARCHQQNGYLVTYGVDLEWRQVTEKLFSPNGPETRGAWIGLRQETRNGVRDFGWTSGERLLFSHWAIHEPRRTPSGDCAAQVEAGTWVAAPCDEPREFICERPRWSRVPGETRAYRRFVERQRWDDAQAICAKNGGRLVTFRTLADQERIARRYPGPVWIGARFDPKIGHFAWADGHELAYTDYAPGEPNLLDAQHCLALDIDGRWYNRECTDKYGFVCEVLD